MKTMSILSDNNKSSEITSGSNQAKSHKKLNFIIN